MFDYEFFASGILGLTNFIVMFNNISFVSFGYLCLCGQALKQIELFYYAKFQSGDIAYDCEEAKQCGKLIKVFIKDVDLIFSYKTGPSSPNKIYTDIYNGTWMERMLCTEQEAVNNAKIYWNKVLVETTELNDKLNPSCRKT